MTALKGKLVSTYVLIHGAWHGGWCWDKVVPLLKMRGHRVEAPDLPGHGKDETPISEISLGAYAEKICKVLDVQSEGVILVGHSLGGIAISQAAEYRPDKVKTLVYLTAFLLRDGETHITQRDPESLVVPQMILSEDGSYVTLREDSLKEVFYGDCSDEDVARAKSLLVPQATAPSRTPIHITEENFGRVPRTYIECLRDKAIFPSWQRKMYTATPCQKILSLETSHSPFLSAPEALVAHLASIGI